MPRHNDTKRVVSEYGLDIKNKIAARAAKPTSRVPAAGESLIFEGTLELMEGKCRISTVTGPPMLLLFEEGNAEEVQKAMRNPVRINVNPETKKIEHLEISNELPSPFGSSFFKAKSIDQLVLEQGVTPLTDWESFGGALPDDGLDEMLVEIYADRRA